MKDLRTLLLEHPFTVDMKPEHCERLLDCAGEVEFQAQEILFRQGDVADKFFLVLSGRVVLESCGPGDLKQEIQTVGAGELLGWSWLFAPYVWHFQARALEAGQAIVFNGAHLLVACEDDHEFGYILMKRIAQVVIQRLQATRKKLLETARPSR